MQIVHWIGMCAINIVVGVSCYSISDDLEQFYWYEVTYPITINLSSWDIHVEM